jgi:hypothetical protein
MMVVLALDLVAFIVFLISFIFAANTLTGPNGQHFTQPANGAALALTNGIIFLLGGIALAVAVFVKQRGAANVCCLVGLFFHALVAVLLLPQWIWQAVEKLKFKQIYPQATSEELHVFYFFYNTHVFNRSTGRIPTTHSQAPVVTWHLYPHRSPLLGFQKSRADATNINLARPLEPFLALSFGLSLLTCSRSQTLGVMVRFIHSNMIENSKIHQICFQKLKK